MSEEKKEYNQTLRIYEEKFGELPEDFIFNYGTVELTIMMKRALKENKKLSTPDEENRGIICS